MAMLKEYTFTVRETYSATVSVDAHSMEEAEKKALEVDLTGQSDYDLDNTRVEFVESVDLYEDEEEEN